MGRPCGPQSVPPICRQLQPEEAQRIASLGLYFNQPESAVICIECGFAIKADGDRVSRHLGEKHGLSRKTRWGLNKLINSLQLPDPRQLPPRQDGCLQHPHLALQRGAACSYCRFRSTSYDLLSRHLKKEHRREVTARTSSGCWLRDHIQDDILFQSWLPGDILAAWRVSTSALETPHLAPLAVKDAELDRQAEAICDAELQRLTSTSLSSPLQSSARSSPRTAREPLSPILVSNWMRRTGWEALFANANRRLLIALYQTPMKADGPYYLGTYEGKPIESPASDEARLCAIIHALDRLFDRCADTVTHTDTAIRRWVRGRFADRPYKAPFQLVAHERSERQYRRLLKRCLCMWLRLWRIPRSTAKALTKRTITYEQGQALRKLWDDPVWSETATTTRQDSTAKSLDKAERGREAAASGQDSKVEDVEDSRARGWGGELDGMLDSLGSEYEDNSDSDISREEDSDYQDDSDDDDDDDGIITPPSSYSEPDQASQMGGTDDDSDDDEEATPRPGQDQQLDVVLRFCLFLAMEDFDDGQASATLLVYFSAVCGLSGENGAEFARPASYTTHLSGLIYCTRLILLEGTLPRVAHEYIQHPARPRRGQLEVLRQVRQDKMCDGTLLPLGEFLSLVAYGISLSRADGPAFLFEWSEDGKEISWDGKHHLTMDGFRDLLATAAEQVAQQCKYMLFGWQPPRPHFRELRDRLSDKTAGYSFVTDPANGLSDAYLQLVKRACTAPMDGLLRRDRVGGGGRRWDMQAVIKYIEKHDELLKDLMIAVQGYGGQGSRISELLTLRHVNTSSQLRGVVLYAGSICCITRHVKNRLSTNKEFQVARFLPDKLGRLMYHYLVYIRPTVSMLRRVCLEKDEEKALLFTPAATDRIWKTSTFSKHLKQHSQRVPTVPVGIGAQLYRQLSIAIAEKHVVGAAAFNRYDEASVGYNDSIAFAWQSGHRPLQRHSTYGLDGAFPDKLQPGLLQTYRNVSNQWHTFLLAESAGRDPLFPQITMPSPVIPQKRPAESMLEPSINTKYNRHLRQQHINQLGIEQSKNVEQPNTPSKSMTCFSSPPTNQSSPTTIKTRIPTSPERHALGPFRILPELRVLVCNTCQFAVLADEVITHLRNSNHAKQYSPKQRRQLQMHIKETTDVIRSLGELKCFQYPPPETPALPYILPPQKDGIRCDQCSYVVRGIASMQRHCREEHNWVNDWERGGNIRQKLLRQRSLPWTTGVYCQRLFASRAGSRWFEVCRGDVPIIAS